MYKVIAPDTKHQTESVRSLYPDEQSYDYIRRQGELFDQSLPELISQYAGEYVLFEDGKVIDSDVDEDKLADRILESDFFLNKKLKAIFVEKVPEKTPINV
jgi:hypothetical protein